ncbi:MAG: secretin N-terminal domain-containing protein [Gammaproteobacteria bacterium]|nr:secretin N-terminal domain-containing protein [Gammaproteobacteria bacterium]
MMQKRVMDDAKNLSLPNSVAEQMMPAANLLVDTKQSNSSEKFDVSVNNVAAKEFFAGLAQGSNCSLVLSPGVTGNVSLSLKQVTLQETLDAVSDLYGYHYEKTSYGYNIYPKQLETRIFMIDKLTLERTLQTSTLVDSSGSSLTTAGSASGGGDSGGGSNSSTVTIQASQKDTFWTDLSSTIGALIDGSSNEKSGAADTPMAQINPETGVIVVRAFPKNMQMVEQYIAKTQSILGRQVIIEAEILDVELATEYSAGIDWSALTAGGVSSMPTAAGQLSSVYQLSMSGDRNNFTYAVSLLSTQGRVSILSKPRVSAINNQSAIIKVGTDNYYVTNVDSQVTSGDGDNTTTSTIDLEAFFSGISLYVTPQITDKGEVNLHIHPAVSEVSEDTLTVEVNDETSTLPVAKSVIRETDTVVHAKNGQVIILGGLMQVKMSDGSSGLPIKPEYQNSFGALTTSKLQINGKTELVILLRPIIVEDEVWKKELDSIAKTAYSEKADKEFLNNAH